MVDSLQIPRRILGVARSQHGLVFKRFPVKLTRLR